ncbi:MAG: hypothetical protein IPG07_18955 [Crocinitomicaceae bacterium]|nr:hypothetical protein [Crocinitomicaceae bacterium]
MLFSKLRWQLVAWLTIKATDFSHWLLRNRKWNLSAADYRNMPVNSTGKKLVTYMDSVQIKFNPCLVKHDLKHILSGYQMITPHELRIQAFLLGNRCTNAMSVIYLALCTAIVPEYISQLLKDFHRGRRAICLKKLNLEALAMLDLTECQQNLRIEPMSDLN